MASNQLGSPKYEVQSMLYDSKALKDELSYYAQRQSKPSQLTSVLTFLLGDVTKNFPLMSRTAGMFGQTGMKSTKGMKEIDDIQYEYPVMGRTIKSVLSSDNPFYAANDKPGIGGQEIKLILEDNWIKENHIIHSQNQVQLYVTNIEKNGSNGFIYTCLPHAINPTSYINPAYLGANRKWTALSPIAARSESRSTTSSTVMPGKFKNQISVLRHGIQWAGNVNSRVMNFNIKTDEGKAMSMWMDWMFYQFELNCTWMTEYTLWYSRYNRSSDGTTQLRDPVTGKEITSGSGLLEQISNKSTYTKLTYDLLSNKIGAALFGQSDVQNYKITLMTGTGGYREFHKACLAAGGTLTNGYGLGDDKIISGPGASAGAGNQMNLKLGGYFSGLYHIDGYYIEVVKNPAFDIGPVALASQAHPETGFPLESYRMVFIDDSEQNGEPNLQFICEKDRVYQDGIVLGLSEPPKSIASLRGNSSGGMKYISNTVDRSEYTRLWTCGIQLLRANRSFDLQCIAGLQ